MEKLIKKFKISQIFNKKKMTHIMVHYDEIGIKGKNKRVFENQLVFNIKEKAKLHNFDIKIRKIMGRLQITTNHELSETEQLIWTNILKTTFGIANFYFPVTCETNFEKIEEKLQEVADKLEFQSFRITAKRADKAFPLNSSEISRKLGGTILKHFDKKGKKTVKMKGADVEFFITIIGKKTSIFCKKIAGSGGLPVKTSGKSLVLISGGIDSPVAAYQIAKRGSFTHFIHFHSYPQTSKASVDKVRELVQILTKFVPKINLYMCPFLEIQKEILKNIPDKYRIIFYRRFMVRIAEEISRKIDAKCLVSGESLGQVASQTIENITITQQATTLPILRPLIGLDKKEIITKAKEIGSYETSIKPHEDCCTVFIPKDPETKGKLDEVITLEKKLDIPKMVNTAIEEIELEKLVYQPN
jgi:thiamine biosynthesis protein ThiI